jgi:hypothetical protein
MTKMKDKAEDRIHQDPLGRVGAMRQRLDPRLLVGGDDAHAYELS